MEVTIKKESPIYGAWKTREELRIQIKKLEKFIESYQDICEHQMFFEGNDHNKNYYRCMNCGKQEWR